MYSSLFYIENHQDDAWQPPLMISQPLIVFVCAHSLPYTPLPCCFIAHKQEYRMCATTRTEQIFK
jgi:hypothetical protein